MRVIIAAAGTGGHINPGIAIANKIKEEEQDSKIIFIGTTRGFENDLVPRSGYELKTIEAYGLTKKITIENIKKMYKTIKGFGEAKKIIKEFKPDIVIGTGGYICGATITAANKLKIPTLLHESNAFPGKAVKMLAKKTDTILVSFKDAISKIKNANRIIYTGTPVKVVKKEYTMLEKEEILKELKLTSLKPIVLIYGGSQGARKINEAVLGIIKLKLNKKYQIIWATGTKQFDIVKENLEELNININNIENTKIIPYIYDMEKMINISELTISRSGAITVAEISNLGKPSILIPLPNVSGDHQLYNAKVLEDIKASVIILNKDLNENILNENIESIILDEKKRKEMGNNALKISTKNVEEKIYKEIKRLVNEKK